MCVGPAFYTIPAVDKTGSVAALHDLIVGPIGGGHVNTVMYKRAVCVVLIHVTDQHPIPDGSGLSAGNLRLWLKGMNRMQFSVFSQLATPVMLGFVMASLVEDLELLPPPFKTIIPILT